MKTALPIFDFSYGETTPLIRGRTDIPAYGSSLSYMRNFRCNILGNAVYRAGFEHITSVSGDFFTQEFKFNKDQAYTLVFQPNKISFLTYDADGNYGVVLNGSGNPLEISTPYSDVSKIYEFSFPQQDDVMYIVYEDYEPMKLRRLAADNFELVTFTRTDDPFSAGNWPRAACFYESRMVYIGSGLNPRKIWGSVQGQYDNFQSVDDFDDEAFSFDIAVVSEALDWGMAGSNSLIIGTVEGCVAVNGGSVDSAITPTNVSASIANDEGCERVMPVIKDGHVIYAEYGGKRTRAFKYDLLTESFKARNINLLNDHLLRSGIRDMVKKKDKDNVIYFVMNNGSLVGASFHPDEERNGWFRFDTDGDVFTISTVTRPDGNYDLIAGVKRIINGVEVRHLERLGADVIFDQRDNYFTGDKEADDLAFNRAIAEQLKSCVYLDASLIFSGEQSSQITFDGSSVIVCDDDVFTQDNVGAQIWYKSEDGRDYGRWEIDVVVDGFTVEVTTLEDPSVNIWGSWYLTSNKFSGLDSLEGETVALVGDGGYINDYVVVNGEIEQEDEFSTACIGLRYRGDIITHNLGFITGGVDTYKTGKNIKKFDVLFDNSAGGAIGTSRYRLDDIQTISMQGNYDLPPLPMNSIQEIKHRDSTDKEKRIYLSQELPLPMTVLSINPYMWGETNI